MSCGLMVMRGIAIGKALYTKIVLIAGTVGTPYSNLEKSAKVANKRVGRRALLTVDVISAEQTSQTYFTPPSLPRVAVFLRMTPMAAIYAASAPGSEMLRNAVSRADGP